MMMNQSEIVISPWRLWISPVKRFDADGCESFFKHLEEMEFHLQGRGLWLAMCHHDLRIQAYASYPFYIDLDMSEEKWWSITKCQHDEAFQFERKP